MSMRAALVHFFALSADFPTAWVPLQAARIELAATDRLPSSSLSRGSRPQVSPPVPTKSTTALQQCQTSSSIC